MTGILIVAGGLCWVGALVVVATTPADAQRQWTAARWRLFTLLASAATALLAASWLVARLATS